MTETVALRVSGLTYTYPDGSNALNGVDLEVGHGERVAILGPNGAGKTTLVLQLNGILTPTSGWVSVSGTPVTKPNLRDIRRRVGIVFQDPDDQLFMPTVREDVAFGPHNLGLRAGELDQRVDEALVAVGMEAYADRAPHHLSFGQRRRVAVATVLSMRPDLLGRRGRDGCQPTRAAVRLHPLPRARRDRCRRRLTDRAAWRSDRFSVADVARAPI